MAAGRWMVMVAMWGGLAAPAMADPALRAVVLSSGGVGQFSFDAEVDGGAALKLDVPLDQVDDVLKSLVVDDPAGPSAGVRLAGMQPLSESFRTLPFQPEAFESAEALLRSLVGEAVSIPATGAHGSILAVSEFQVASHDEGGVTRHRLTIATDAGLQTVVLEDTPGVEFSSEALRGQIAAALAAIAAQRVQDRRTLLLTLAPGGHRHVRFCYVVSVPVWKATYRLSLPGPAGGPGRLRAFAVVENLSGRDWHDVSVTLTSGQPVLFRTPLYQPRFVDRPEAPVDGPGGLAPPVDAFAAAAPAPALLGAAPANGLDRRPLPRPHAAPALRGAAFAPMAAAKAPPPADISESMAQVSFHLAAPVTASSGQSLLLPILDEPIGAQRVSLFQAETDPVHPLVALLLTNSGPGALPPGVVSLFEDPGDGSAYVGDARLPAMEPGEDRLASFAVDLGVTVDAQKGDSEEVIGGRISHGVLSLTRRRRVTVAYRVTVAKDGPGQGGRALVIEQAKVPDYRLAEPSGDGVTETPYAYRVRRTVAAGKTQTITLVTEHSEGEQQELVASDVTGLLAIARNGMLPSPLRDALQHAAALRADLDRQQAELQRLRGRIGDIVNDQARVRQNLYGVPADSALHQRYLALMESQETEIESLHTETDTLQKQVDAADEALKTYLDGLSL